MISCLSNNVFEMEFNDLKCEFENFSIRDFFIYSVNLLLSKTEE